MMLFLGDLKCLFCHIDFITMIIKDNVNIFFKNNFSAIIKKYHNLYSLGFNYQSAYKLKLY